MVLQLDPGDDEAEQRIRMALERRSARALNEAIHELRLSLYPDDYSNFVSADREAMRAYEQFVTDQKLRDAVSRAVQDAADLGVSVAVQQFDSVGFGFDWTLANVAARDWAAAQTNTILQQLGTTTSRVVGQAVSRWIDNGEPLEALIRDLEPAFGRMRAERIAATEVTRAYAEGNRTAYRESGVVQEWEWRTAQDEIVCPTCGGLNGKRRRLDEPFDSGINGPPAHPNCRCWAVPVVDERKQEQVEAQQKPVEWKPSMSRADVDRWAVDSAIRQDTYHVTPGVANERSIMANGFDLSKQKFGRMWGDGVYVGTDTTTAEQYRRWTGQSARTLKTRLDVRKPAIFDAGGTSSFTQDDILQSVLNTDRATVRRLTRGGGDLSSILRAQGFDALHIRNAGEAAGGNQIVVFDPKNVVVIND